MPTGDNQSSMRHRKKYKLHSSKDLSSVGQQLHRHEYESDSTSYSRDEANVTQGFLFWWIKSITGVIFMFVCGCCHGYFVRSKHENTLWFSNIEVGLTF